jgi:hypothetical protein
MTIHVQGKNSIIDCALNKLGKGGADPFIRPSSDWAYFVMALSVRRPSEFVQAIIPDSRCRFEQYFTQLLPWI